MTLMLQLAPAARDSPQLFATRNSLLLVPVSERAVILRLTFPVFATVTACDVLIVLALCVGNDSVDGVTVIGVNPLPASVIVCGLVVAPSLTAIVPLRVPPLVGANVTAIVQLPPASTLVPQLFV